MNRQQRHKRRALLTEKARREAEGPVIFRMLEPGEEPTPGAPVFMLDMAKMSGAYASEDE